MGKRLLLVITAAVFFAVGLLMAQALMGGLGIGGRPSAQQAQETARAESERDAYGAVR
jgi:hypothetical protein